MAKVAPMGQSSIHHELDRFNVCRPCVKIGRDLFTHSSVSVIMDYYQVCFGGLILLSGVLLVSQPTRRHQLEQQGVTRISKHPESRWYKVYALAVAADWLQGPYLFSLYMDEYGLAPNLVLNLYLTDFATTAISAYFIGALADKYGRKLYCMIYCVSYALSCFLTVVPVTPLLFLGRILGGISTSILFTVFDSWMVTNFHQGKLAEDGCDLSRTYAATSFISSLAAILSGLMGEVLVWATGTKKNPFLMSIVLLWSALHMIWPHWGENFGVSVSAKPTQAATRRSLWSVLKTPSILALTFASTMFDGSMNLFVFYWIPALSSLYKSAGELPYGIIYSSFMAVSMAGALAFNIIMNKQIVKYTQLLVGVLLVAGFCFVKLAGAKTETGAFWLFCLLEACIGIFTPCVGYLKGTLIDDDTRATVYSIMRTPFNIVVIVSLVMAKGNDNIGGIVRVCIDDRERGALLPSLHHEPSSGPDRSRRANDENKVNALLVYPGPDLPEHLAVELLSESHNARPQQCRTPGYARLLASGLVAAYPTSRR
ncbi:hypothetical protein E0Z10_g5228 [Xylaria hypoxylon]|uniref:Molybdate-anion transporter n=1 Tax=Xylaria hypoxylon TaxID=37992 RepID=A0A4Z0YYF5_9PEZI|nr:hypothetical protein E0Z10_g5228 [Xylaria hypoxylon]